MKNKYISNNEYFNNILPGTQVSFGTISPFTALNFPANKTAFVAWYGNMSFSSAPSIAIGTLEACRYGEGTVTYDFDRYPIYTTGTPSVYEIVGPQKPPYHWSSDIPPHLLSQIPQTLQNSLNKEKVNGFFLDASEGPYTCAICRENYQGNDIWWNPRGLRCRDCWANIQKKIIPSLDYDSDDKVWIKEWQLQYDYSLHPATRNKLRRQGLLKGRDLKRANGTIYCTVYLVRENEDFLKNIPRNLQ